MGLESPTELVNPGTKGIDVLATAQMLAVMNGEDQKVAEAVQAAIPAIAVVVDKIVEAFGAGGRLIYVGAGTSGRLGVLDASECVPTFSVPPELVVGVIAGGDVALRHPVEGAEDDGAAGVADLKAIDVCGKDVVVGVSASGNPAYVVSALEAAKAQGAYTAAVTCTPEAKIAMVADAVIVTVVGPEVVAGSSRMKAGTAQKLVLNMLSTGAMIRWGKTYADDAGNWMVDVKATNEKLKARAVRLVVRLAGVDAAAAQAALEANNYAVKPVLLMLMGNVDFEAAVKLLDAVSGRLRVALEGV